MERIRLAVRRNRPVRGEEPNQLRRVGRVGHEALVDGPDCAEAGNLEAVIRVEAGDVRLVGDLQLTAARATARAAARPTAAGRGGPTARDRNTHRDRTHQLCPTPPAHLASPLLLAVSRDAKSHW